jgi:hypothetical protein
MKNAMGITKLPRRFAWQSIVLGFVLLCDFTLANPMTGSAEIHDPTSGAFAAGGPSLDISMSQSIYVNGDTITMSEFRLKNPSSSPVAVRMQVGVVVPIDGPEMLIDIGSDGRFVLPANLDENLGPFLLQVVSARFPTRGIFEFHALLSDPITGTVLSEDVTPFVVQ